MPEDNEINEKDIFEQIEDMDFILPESPLTRESADRTENLDPFEVWDLEGMTDETNYLTPTEGESNEEEYREKWEELENMLVEFHDKLGITAGFTKDEGSILSHVPESKISFDINYRIDRIYDEAGVLRAISEIVIDIERERWIQPASKFCI